jgi:hypothetical protein
MMLCWAFPKEKRCKKKTFLSDQQKVIKKLDQKVPDYGQHNRFLCKNCIPSFQRLEVFYIKDNFFSIGKCPLLMLVNQSSISFGV